MPTERWCKVEEAGVNDFGRCGFGGGPLGSWTRADSWNDESCKRVPLLCETLKPRWSLTDLEDLPWEVAELPGRSYETIGMHWLRRKGDVPFHRNPERWFWQVCIFGCEGHSYIQVGGDAVSYREGEPFTFDGPFDHVAWNNGKGCAPCGAALLPLESSESNDAAVLSKATVPLASWNIFSLRHREDVCP